MAEQASAGLSLYFPQWQGAGEGGRPLLQGAAAIRSALGSRVRFDEVELEPDARLTLEHGIIGRAALLAQLRRASDVLTRKDPSRIRVVGGDCAIEIAPVAFLARRYREDLALVWIDAHADLQAPETSPSSTLHGMPLRILLGEGARDFTAAAHPPLEPNRIFLVGVRDLDPPERAIVEARRISQFPVEDLDADATSVARAVADAGFSRAYVHLDLDVLDPGEFASLAVPTQGGLRVRTLVELLESLRSALDVVGFAITECSPSDGLLPASDARALATLLAASSFAEDW
jgi:arginase